MCYYLVATLPSNVNIRALKPTIERYHMGFEMLENPYILHQLPKGERLFYATKRHCDCDTALGCDVGALNTNELEGEIERLRKKGWGQAKIERWKSERDDLKEVDRLNQDKELEIWYAFISEALEGNNATHIGIMKHFFAGSVEQEKVKISEIKEVRIKGIKPKYLRKIEDDTLYNFIQ